MSTEYDYIQQYMDRGKLRIRLRPPKELVARGVKGCALPGPVGSPEFRRAYAEALAAVPAPRPAKIAPNSIIAWVDRFMAAGAFQKLSDKTQYRYRYEFNKLVKRYGERRADTMPREMMAQILGEITIDYSRRDCIKATRALFRWAVDHHLRADNPTVGFSVTLEKTDGHHTWTDDEIAQYRAHWPFGSIERLTFELAFEAQARRGDCCLIGPKNRKGDRLEFTQAKHRHRSESLVSIEIVPELAAAIDRYPLRRGAATYLETKRGRKRPEQSLGRSFRGWVHEAGLPDRCTLHGLRKAMARVGAEAGGSERELMAKGGWRSSRQVEVYTRMADRKRMADNLNAKIAAARAASPAVVVAFPKRRA